MKTKISITLDEHEMRSYLLEGLLKFGKVDEKIVRDYIMRIERKGDSPHYQIVLEHELESVDSSEK